MPPGCCNSRAFVDIEVGGAFVEVPHPFAEDLAGYAPALREEGGVSVAQVVGDHPTVDRGLDERGIPDSIPEPSAARFAADCAVQE